MNSDADFDTVCPSPEDTTPIGDDIERRRNHLRVYDCEGAVTVAAQDGTPAIEGELLDESCGGIGLAIDAGSTIEAGAFVTVDFFGMPARGFVCYREPLDDGRSRIGVQWQAGN